jgi:hypothetical protein
MSELGMSLVWLYMPFSTLFLTMVYIQLLRDAVPCRSCVKPSILSHFFEAMDIKDGLIALVS